MSPMPPEPPTESVWAAGSCTVRQAMKRTHFSRDRLFELMRNNEVVWYADGGRGTRVIAWLSLVAVIERESAAQERGAGRER